MTRDFADQVFLITGASAGIGAAFAEEVGRRGAAVVLVARRVDRLQELAARVGPLAHVVPADVTVRAEVEAALRSALARFGRVDVWVNNAGRGLTRSFEQLTDEDVDAMVRDNLKSALYGMQAVLPHFKDRRRGVLVNVSSMLSRAPLAPSRSAYSASKAALNALAEALRLELAADWPDLHVVTVMPGVVATDFGNNALGGGVDSRTLPGAQSVQDVAQAMAEGILARRKDVYTRPEGFAHVLGYLKELAGEDPRS